jgi:hypothetical protein
MSNQGEGKMGVIETLNELARLKAENDILKAARVPGKITIEISADGRQVSVYGLLYREQWERWLNPTITEQIRALLPSLPL